MLMIDCQIAGISGDMLLSSLVDLGANRSKVIDAIFACQNFVKGSKIKEVSFEEVKRSGFRTLLLKLDYEDNVDERRGEEVYTSIARCCDYLDLENRARRFALDSIRRIIEAEARVHGESYQNVHLHEASSIDTVIDVIGVAIALQDLGIYNEEVYATKVAVGGGSLTFSHGITSNPASAILEILANFTIIGGPVDYELTTPTGAAMLATLASSSLNFYPAMKPIRVGYGAGKREFEGFPNMLKVVLGKSDEIFSRESIYLLETNIDDASGEILGGLIDNLIDKGAKDVSIIPALTKKNRPASVISVICDRDSLNNVIESLVHETGTLGVRVQEVQRYTLPRSILTINVSIRNEDFTVRVKVARSTSGSIVNIKPEYDDVKNIAKRLGLPYRVALSLVDREVREKIEF